MRLRWHPDEPLWRPRVTGHAARLRTFGLGIAHFSDNEIVKALLDIVDEKRSADEEVKLSRLDGSGLESRFGFRRRPPAPIVAA